MSQKYIVGPRLTRKSGEVVTKNSVVCVFLRLCYFSLLLLI